MPRSLFTIAAAFAILAATRAFASDPNPTQWVSPDGHVYSPPSPVGNPFPSSVYGVLHGGSNFSLQRPFLSPFGRTDNSRGRFVYYADSFYPRGSEGVFGVDAWLEQQDAFGNWNPVNQNGGVSDDGTLYWTVNRTNPGPSASRTFTWTYADLPANTNFRVFVYIYIYNQGGGSSGYFPLSSTTQVVNTGATNDAPRIVWTQNPAQATTGQNYTISARGEDDNGDLATVSIDKNGQGFAYAGGGNGYTGDSQNTTSDGVGTVTFTAWATDSLGARSPTISWTVNVVPKANQSAVSSSNATITFLQSFTPSYIGGAGSGGWQFVVSGQTNFDPNDSSHSGTKLFPSNAWSSSWTPPQPGNYTFFVVRVGDSSYNPSATAGPYTLTVLPSAPVGSFDAISAASVTQGQPLTGSGWAADAQLGAPLSSVTLLVDGGTSGSITASLNGYRPDVQSANTSFGHWSPRDITNSGWSFSLNTSSLAAGAHTITAIANDSTYAISANLGSKSFSVSALLGQTVGLTPSAPTVNAGDTVNFSATGGQNGYVWGGSASGSGSTKSVTFFAAGTFSVTVYSPAGGSYAQSNIATATITVISNASQTVSIAPASQTIGVGASVTFTASGGVNGYAWSGSASGSGNSKTVTFSAVGSYTVSVYSPAGSGYNQSNTATATITVANNSQTVALTPATQTIMVGDSVNFSAAGGVNGYVWGGAASGSDSTKAVSFNSPGTFSVTAYSPAGGGYSQSNTAASMITVNAIAATFTVAPTSFSYTGFVCVPTITASPVAATYSVSGTPSATNPGSYSFTVTATGNYAGSATIPWSIGLANQSAVALSPASVTTTAGQTVTFTASGGSGTGAFAWGGVASGTGTSKTITFSSIGTASVTVYRTGDSIYGPSNTATASVDVVAATYALTVNAGLGGTATGSATGLVGTATVAISATPSPGYVFASWTGDPVADASANSTFIAIGSANRSITANFTASVAQSITFTPPTTASYPSTPLTLSATASSGLPVTFALVSGPGNLAGSQLTISGTGIVIVRASQAGGLNAGVFFQPAPNVDRSIQVNPPFSILRLRFNTPANLDGSPTGNRSLDGDNLAHSAPPNKRSTYIFTNPAGLASSRWPHFDNPQRIQPVHANTSLPLAPVATSSSDEARLNER